MRFVIIASPRTGSTHLTSLLNEQDDIACHGEIFHPKKVFVRWPRQDKAPEAMAKLMKLREQDPQRFLDHISANGRIYLVSSAARVGGDPAGLIARSRRDKINTSAILWRFSNAGEVAEFSETAVSPAASISRRSRSTSSDFTAPEKGCPNVRLVLSSTCHRQR